MDVKISNLGKFKILKNNFEVSKGLRFSKKLKENEGIILVSPVESKNALIVDMLFVFYSLDIAFLNSKKKVVDIRRNVKPINLFVKPKVKAKYVLEMNSGGLKNLKIGSTLEF